MPLPKTQGRPSGYSADDDTPVKEYEDDMRTGARGVIRSRARAQASTGARRASYLSEADEYQRDVQRGAEGGMAARRRRGSSKRR